MVLRELLLLLRHTNMIIIGYAITATFTIVRVILVIKRFVDIFDMNDWNEIKALLFFLFLWLLLSVTNFSIIGI